MPDVGHIPTFAVLIIEQDSPKFVTYFAASGNQLAYILKDLRSRSNVEIIATYTCNSIEQRITSFKHISSTNARS